ncbi:BatA domain-containing protein [Lutibacter sp. B1]|uniref:BatA domain-containing protein n=1 Tax=Lutibacter sp. B1 TaxID=2725996 RepID=UPI0014575022|nr:BatA domain-containing protein [Lutibacter sp. B1]NLP56999.1 hypothetical protein [Lutibacter sp. B1]
MQFKYPEILYALLLLIIPIIVHLFQLQRFVKVPFTNVKFLQKIEKQTRKSSRLKKWLILLTRMLAFTCLILAFAQPYFSKYSLNQKFKTSIYLDNSFSMQAKGENGELLKNAGQKIIKNLNEENQDILVFTNTKNYNNLDPKNLKNELINIKYSPELLDINSILLKLKDNKPDEINSLNENILISDFQNINNKNKTVFTNVNSPIRLIKIIPKNTNNIFIDSVYLGNEKLTETTLNVVVKSIKNTTENIAISLYNNTILIGKSTSKFNNSKLSIVQFTIPNTTNFNGKISLTDDVLEFDNDFYFSISKPEKINVLSIGNSSEFLPRIYTQNEFNFTSTPLQKLNYNTIQNQHLIILNEIENIPSELTKSLNEFSKNGGNLLVIPSENLMINSYNNLLNSLNVGIITSKIEQEHLITSINYNHPIINNVFEKKVFNFQYPKTTLYYQTNFQNSSSIINLDNTQPFISTSKVENGFFYWISSPLNKEISTFTQSPLIVPVFYNVAKQSLNIEDLYYTIKPQNEINLNTAMEKDEVLKMKNEKIEFIPLQNISQNKVTLKLENNDLESGFYNIMKNEQIIKTIAFNYNRSESDLTYLALDSIAANNKNITVSSDIDEIFEKINNQQKINWLFKWFLAFSVLFLLIEMLILKYFKI